MICLTTDQNDMFGKGIIELQLLPQQDSRWFKLRCHVNNADVDNSKCIKSESTDDTEMYGNGLFNWPYCSTPETCATATFSSIDAN